MKPKNNFQRHIIGEYKKLPKITPAQKRYAFKHCFDHIGKRNAKGMVTCLECGHKWQSGGELADTLLGNTCPHCNTELKINITRTQVFKQTEYFCIVTTHGEFQVLRFFLVKAYYKAGEKAFYTIDEVVQRWIAPNGKNIAIARSRFTMSLCYDLWSVGSQMEVRNYHKSQDIYPAAIYPRQRYIHGIERCNFSGDYHSVKPFDFLYRILTDNKAETLLKTGQGRLLSHFIRSATPIENYWSTIRICLRNNYVIEDGSIWCDYIDLLKHFGKDAHNPKYVCPSNLHEEHNRYVFEKEGDELNKALMKKQSVIETEEPLYKEQKGIFFGIQFTDGEISVSVLENVKAVFEEGFLMKHCVYRNKYHLKKDRLILSATINGNRIETVEVSLTTMQVVQCRGVENKNTQYHDRIISLVNKNINQIRSRMAA